MTSRARRTSGTRDGDASHADCETSPSYGCYGREARANPKTRSKPQIQRVFERQITTDSRLTADRKLPSALWDRRRQRSHRKELAMDGGGG